MDRNEMIAKIKRNLNLKGIIKVPKFFFSLLSNPVKDIMAERKIEKQMKKKRKKPIKVAFILQLPEAWDKIQRIYNIMVKSPAFIPFIVIVPKFDLVESRLASYGDEKKYFEQFQHGNNVIYAWNGNRYISIQEFGFDYVVYSSPYDHYLPDKLRSDTVSRFSKICYVSYAYSSRPDFHSGYNRDFFRNVYMCFMESKESADYIGKKINKQYQKSYYMGYPAVEGISIKPVLEYKNVLWTPRWIYDAQVGGSHFFEYKEDVLSLTSKGFSLTIRPHPFAFDNFIKTGDMTKEEVEDYKNRIMVAGAVLDTNKEFSTTMDDADILITDISSIILNFFLTGKPIIYCECNQLLVEEFEKMKECMYTARDWSEIEAHLEKLKSGDDYLREKREALCKQFGSDHMGSSERIVEEITRDFEKPVPLENSSGGI